MKQERIRNGRCNRVARLEKPDGLSEARDFSHEFFTKEEEKKIAEIKAKIKDASDLVAFMYDHCVACAEEYTDWTARKAVKEIAKEMLGLDLD